MKGSLGRIFAHRYQNFRLATTIPSQRAQPAGSRPHGDTRPSAGNLDPDRGPDPKRTP